MYSTTTIMVIYITICNNNIIFASFRIGWIHCINDGLPKSTSNNERMKSGASMTQYFTMDLIYHNFAINFQPKCIIRCYEKYIIVKSLDTMQYLWFLFMETEIKGE